MGIFKNITKILKKAAPVIGGTIGFAIGGPMGSAALGAAFGSGIGTLVGGGDTDDALWRSEAWMRISDARRPK